MDEQIKNSFQKVKQDIDSINKEINILNQFLYENKEKFSEIDKSLKELSFKLSELSLKKEERIPTQNPANNLQNPTFPTQNPANNLPFKPSNPQNKVFSTGNEGVPADRQTNQQTNQQTEKASFNNAIEVLSSLDNLKKEIRNKFKRITEQEFLVFSTIYQIEEEVGYADYKSLSQKLNLTESSIRDYVGKLIKKGIPVDKTKINNKMIQLSVSEKLKKIAPLPVLFQLRSL
jgi:DNA-binding MarR family transcriptional regulator